MPLASALCYMLRQSCSLVDHTMSLAANVLKTTLAVSVSQQLHGACFKWKKLLTIQCWTPRVRRTKRQQGQKLPSSRSLWTWSVLPAYHGGPPWWTPGRAEHWSHPQSSADAPLAPLERDTHRFKHIVSRSRISDICCVTDLIDNTPQKLTHAVLTHARKGSAGRHRLS